MTKREAKRIMSLPAALQYARILYQDDRLLAAHQNTPAPDSQARGKCLPTGRQSEKIQGKLFRLQNYEQKGLAL